MKLFLLYSCHWFLAIICFPGQDGCLRISDNTPIDLPKPQPKPSPAAAVAAAAVAAAATTHSKLKGLCDASCGLIQQWLDLVP